MDKKRDAASHFAAYRAQDGAPLPICESFESTDI